MQALQTPEACISDVHQRDCVNAFIVVIDGQMPNWKKLMFSHLALWLPLENCGFRSRKNVSESLSRNHQLPLSVSPVLLWFGS